jgi:uncharacterized protein YceK
MTITFFIVTLLIMGGCAPLSPLVLLKMEADLEKAGETLIEDETADLGHPLKFLDTPAPPLHIPDTLTAPPQT